MGPLWGPAVWVYGRCLALKLSLPIRGCSGGPCSGMRNVLGVEDAFLPNRRTPTGSHIGSTDGVRAPDPGGVAYWCTGAMSRCRFRKERSVFRFKFIRHLPSSPTGFWLLAFIACLKIPIPIPNKPSESPTGFWLLAFDFCPPAFGF